ncbi:hypothetical protein M3Y97_00832100 [Aphelenchoides bicaudatus]|nr:hypothetical protein M3Y97_00832100 [Aphelenchoides bicaudatus]
MSERLREKLNFLHDELDGLRAIQRSISPSKLMAKSSRRSSRSPRPSNVGLELPSTPAHDSRPNIAAWPAPPPNPLTKVTHSAKLPLTTSTGTSPIPESHFQGGSAFGDDSSRLLSMFMSANSPGGIRGREHELRRKIQNLEETVAEYERQKYNVMGTFSEYREYVAERERTLEAEYSNKIIALSEEVLNAKKDFESRMKTFEQFNNEKEQALENLRQEHQREIEMLERKVAGSQLLNLEQKYIIEIRRLEDERKSLKLEKERLVETFDMKLRRAQSLYETQLQTAKQLYSKELDTLRSHEENLKEELAARHEEFRDRVQELKLQSRQSREEVSSCKTEINMLQKKLKQKESELEGITKELETARNELIVSMRKLREVDIRYAKTYDELSQKETELNKKAELLDAAEDSRSHLESTIRKLQVEVKALKNKVDFLEIERDNLQCQNESQANLTVSVQAVLESLTREKETSKEHYEKLLEQADDREKTLRNRLVEQHSPKLHEEEEGSSSSDYIVDVTRAVDSICKNIQKSVQKSTDTKLDVTTSATNSDLQRKLDDLSDEPRNEIHIVVSKLVQVEREVQTIIMEKDEAKSKLIRLEEENRNLAMRLNGNDEQREELTKMKEKFENYRKQTVELAKAVDDVKNKEKEVNDLNTNLQQADRKNKILLELIEYQKGTDENTVDEILSEVGADDVSQEELHKVFEKKLKKLEKKPSVETRHIETSTKPEVREMSLQTNIEIKQAPSESEVLQNEIVGMLANMMNGKADQYADLLELKTVLMSAMENTSSSDEMPDSPRLYPQVCQKAASKLQNLVSHMTDRRDKKYKSGTSSSERIGRKDDQTDVSRSRSPSLLSRLRERTPSKTTSGTSMEQSMSSRNLAYSDKYDPKRKQNSSSKPAWKF